MHRIYLSIVIPAFNESRRISSTLEKVHDYCSFKYPSSHEILVIDDGSTDGTAGVVSDLRDRIPTLRVHRYEMNRGKGFAVKTGMMQARGHVALLTDADLSTPIEEFDKFTPFLDDDYPIVIATRKSGGSDILEHQPLWRESMGKVFTWLSNTILGLNVTDFTCGFKAFRLDQALPIFIQQRIERWAYDSELLFLANRHGLKIVEAPVIWKNSPQSRVRIVRDTITSLFALFQIRWNAVSRKYDRPYEHVKETTSIAR